MLGTSLLVLHQGVLRSTLQLTATSSTSIFCYCLSRYSSPGQCFPSGVPRDSLLCRDEMENWKHFDFTKNAIFSILYIVSTQYICDSIFILRSDHLFLAQQASGIGPVNCICVVIGRIASQAATTSDYIAIALRLCILLITSSQACLRFFEQVFENTSILKRGQRSYNT